jgi:ankyrin repeat protein
MKNVAMSLEVRREVTMMRARCRTTGVAVVLCALLGSMGVDAAGTRSSLLDAVEHADVSTIRALLLKDPSEANQSEADGTTALHRAVLSDNVEVVDLLLRHGANVNAVNRYGVPPLDVACLDGNVAIVERLLKAGADATVTRPGGQTVLMTAARTGNPEIIKALLRSGVDVNAREAVRGQTALMFAASANEAAAIRALIEGGAEVGAVSRGVIAPDGIICDKCARFGGRPQSRVDKATALLFAVRRGHIEAVRALLEAGANPNDTLPARQSALIVAIANAKWETAAVLLDAGADPNAAAAGWTPLHQLVRTHRGLDTNRFPHPVATGTVSPLDLAKKLLAHGANVDAKMTRRIADEVRTEYGPGGTALGLAAKSTDHALMRLLLANGADPYAVNDLGTTVLMAATGTEMANPGEDTGEEEDAFEAVKIAVEAGVDVNAVNATGKTAIFAAITRGSIPMVQYLVDHGARLDVTSKWGWTPLLTAEFGEPYANTQLKSPEVAVVLRKLMKEKGVSTERPSDEELYDRIHKECGGGIDLRPAPPGGTFADRCHGRTPSYMDNFPPDVHVAPAPQAPPRTTVPQAEPKN